MATLSTEADTTEQLISDIPPPLLSECNTLDSKNILKDGTNDYLLVSCNLFTKICNVVFVSSDRYNVILPLAKKLLSS